MTSWKTSTALVLGLTVLTYAVVGGVMAYAFTFWFSDTAWVYGTALFLLFALAIAVYSYFVPVPRVMRAYNARRVTKYSEPRLCAIVGDLASRAGVPTPEVYVCDVDFPNAFALGRTPETAMVAATRPLLDMLDDDELAGVMGHELSHIIHRDTIVNTAARTSAKFLSVSALVMGAIGMAAAAMLGSGEGKSSGGGGILFLVMFVILIPVVAVCLVMLLALPSAGAVMRFGVSRSREYGADESSARLTGRPMALASALTKMEAACGSQSNTFRDSSSANLWIVNPFGKFRKRMLNSLMDTHPSTESRIARLRELDREINGRSVSRIPSRVEERR